MSEKLLHARRLWTSARTSERTIARVPRFVVSGLLVMAIHLGSMTVLLTVVEMPVQPALALSYVFALCAHFTLNRRFVFASRAGYAHRLPAQTVLYISAALTSYAISAVILAFVPDWLDVSPLAVFLVTSPILAAITFVVLNVYVFRRRTSRPATREASSAS
jgi:putative flippase GtrA